MFAFHSNSEEQKTLKKEKTYMFLKLRKLKFHFFKKEKTYMSPSFILPTSDMAERKFQQRRFHIFELSLSIIVQEP